MSGREQQLWIMVDIETSGPVYGHHSLVELGAVAGSRERGVIAEFSALISPIGAAVERSRRTYLAAKERGAPPSEVMARFWDWSKPHVDAGAQFVARPAAFDWPWIVYYAWTYLGKNPFGFKAVCASSWFEALGKRFHVDLPHVAVDDARIQLLHFFEAL
jgi:hypothetical protein